MGHAEVPVGHLADVLAFLMAEDRHVDSFEAGETGNERRVVLELPVPVQLHEVGEKTADIIEGVRAVEVPRELGALPVRQFRVRLLFHLGDLFPEDRKLFRVVWIVLVVETFYLKDASFQRLKLLFEIKVVSHL
ncbi:MAG: hypothetical protein A4E61_00562 [Syntrophorhabdus sp. PtaB.Bin184]|nr:MAG: hypothetical protein A4E61_00562 [Syntrophorhabdus sp. PtaB.Bin184]